jgi:diacylglycerol diphosphate phosphatase / phosphatidate phosphatase
MSSSALFSGSPWPILVTGTASPSLPPTPHLIHHLDSYSQYYPSLASALSHRPYSPRIRREDDQDLPVYAHHRVSDSQARRRTRDDASPGHHEVEFQRTHYRDESGSDELPGPEGTVLRTGPGNRTPLESVWKDGDQETGTV